MYSYIKKMHSILIVSIDLKINTNNLIIVWTFLLLTVYYYLNKLLKTWYFKLVFTFCTFHTKVNYYVIQ